MHVALLPNAFNFQKAKQHTMPSHSVLPPTSKAPAYQSTHPRKDESQSLSETEFSLILNRWSQQAPHSEDRTEASRRMLHCFRNSSSASSSDLNLSGLGLTEVPPELLQLTNLRSLDLSDNPIHSLPSEFSKLRNLKSLRMNNNQLNEFPMVLQSLTGLQELELDDNQISKLPDTFWQSNARLNSLYLRNNLLIKLPEVPLQRYQSSIPGVGHVQGLEFKDRPKLTMLDVEGNQLRTLPKTLNYFPWLESLNAANNEFECWPESISQAPALKTFTIENKQTLQDSRSTIPESETLTPHQIATRLDMPFSVFDQFSFG